MTFTGKHLVVIGGSSGIGFRVAERAIAAGATVLIGGRSQGRLDAACARLGPAAEAAPIDTADPASIARFFDGVERIDHLFTPGASYRVASFRDADDETARSPFEAKFWGQYRAVRAALPKFSPQASVVLMSGAASARPPAAAAAYAACNGAIETLGRALAVELAPVRVNVVSPGTIDSDLWRGRPAPLRKAAFASYAGLSLLGRVGTVDEVAETVIFLLGNGFMTGSTLFSDGGFALR
jgi:NAD(P)-dependent dehydrogenase (short-subunit alcohol dehydrogenase family)